MLVLSSLFLAFAPSALPVPIASGMTAPRTIPSRLPLLGGINADGGADAGRFYSGVLMQAGGGGGGDDDTPAWGGDDDDEEWDGTDPGIAIAVVAGVMFFGAKGGKNRDRSGDSILQRMRKNKAAS